MSLSYRMRLSHRKSSRAAFAAMLLTCISCGCGGDALSGSPESAAAAKIDSPPPPAKIETPQESNVAVLQLTAKAQDRLGIRLAPVTRRSMPRRRTFGGEVLVPVGRVIPVTAPAAGTLTAPDAGRMPAPGSRVQRGQKLFVVTPLLSPERDVPTPAERVQMASAEASLISSRIVAQGDVERTTAEVEAAKIELARAQQLLSDKAGSGRGVDDAQARLNVANSNLSAAKARFELLERLTLEATEVDPTPIEIVAPQDGVVRAASAAPGQVVAAGSLLFELVDLSNVWIRVPVYVGLESEIDRAAPAMVVPLGDGGKSKGRAASPVSAPPSADPIAASADLFYEIENSDGRYRPGERVGVTLTLAGSAEYLTVPWSAVLHDAQGGTWVYEQLGEHDYRRSRVQLLRVDGATAVLEAGPKPGTQVVASGAAELFGTEFGAGK